MNILLTGRIIGFRFNGAGECTAVNIVPACSCVLKYDDGRLFAVISKNNNDAKVLEYKKYVTVEFKSGFANRELLASGLNHNVSFELAAADSEADKTNRVISDIAEESIGVEINGIRIFV